MGGFSAGQELSLFSCLYAGADEGIHVQGLHVSGVAQGAGRDVQRHLGHGTAPQAQGSRDGED